jgi:hypothetical protein
LVLFKINSDNSARLTDYRHCAITLRYGRPSPAGRTDLYTWDIWARPLYYLPRSR